MRDAVKKITAVGVQIVLSPGEDYGWELADVVVSTS